MSLRRRIPTLLLSIALCSTLFAQDSTDAEAHFNRGEAHLESKQYSDAIKEFKRALELKSKWAEAYYKLGLAYSAVPFTNGDSGENFKAALKAFEEAVRLRPDWPEALTELGSSYTSILKYDKAVAHLKKAISLNKELAAAHENLGLAYLRLGRHAEAIVRLEEAVRLKPERAQPHRLLGLAYLIVEDREKAVAQYQILQSLDQESAKYLNETIQSGRKPTFVILTGKLISAPKPDYPSAAKSRGITGNVTVELEIDEQGNVVFARALNGPVELRAAAEAAGMKARFTVTKLSGKPVPVKGVISFNFVP